MNQGGLPSSGVAVVLILNLSLFITKVSKSTTFNTSSLSSSPTTLVKL